MRIYFYVKIYSFKKQESQNKRKVTSLALMETIYCIILSNATISIPQQNLSFDLNRGFMPARISVPSILKTYDNELDG